MQMFTDKETPLLLHAYLVRSRVQLSQLWDKSATAVLAGQQETPRSAKLKHECDTKLQHGLLYTIYTIYIYIFFFLTLLLSSF